MTDLERAHSAAQRLQQQIAKHWLDKKHPTLDELFNMLGAAMVAQDFLRAEVEMWNATDGGK